MQLLGDAADNPDQRIADDIRLFIDQRPLPSASACWPRSSRSAPSWSSCGLCRPRRRSTCSASRCDIPGYLVWAALIYAVVGTALTHWIGRALIALNFQQQRYEADFRFNLVRVRENAEQIALLDGEPPSASGCSAASAGGRQLVAIMSRQKKLTFLTAGYGQARRCFRSWSSAPPISPARPARRADADRVGLRQRPGALSFFVTVYRSIAEWRAVDRTARRLRQSIAAAPRGRHEPPVIALAPGEAAPSASRT